MTTGWPPRASRDPRAERIALARRTIERGSRSFALAAKLLDPPTRADAMLLYAWCRHCDDAIDGQVLGLPGDPRSPALPAGQMEGLRAATRSALAGAATDAIFAGLGDVVRRNAIPERYVQAHLEGFAMDAEGRRYDTLADTLDYCYAVAGVVGIMMGYVLGVRDTATLMHARDLGIAFQLTNIARDLVDDARVGRVYCPAEWLAQEGLAATRLADPSCRPELARVARRLLDTALPYYESAAVGIRALPLRAAWAIATASAVYREIGTQVLREGVGAWDRRVSTAHGRKLRLAAEAAVQVVVQRLHPPVAASDMGAHEAALGERPVSLPPCYRQPFAALDPD